MDITYKDYVISKVGSSLTYNLIKKVIRTSRKGVYYEGKKTMGSMSFKRCVETIIDDSIRDKCNTIDIISYFYQYREELNNFKQFIENEQIRTS